MRLKFPPGIQVLSWTHKRWRYEVSNQLPNPEHPWFPEDAPRGDLCRIQDPRPYLRSAPIHRWHENLLLF